MLKNTDQFHQNKFNLNKYSRLNVNMYINESQIMYEMNTNLYAKLYCNEQNLWIKINKIKSTN